MIDATLPSNVGIVLNIRMQLPVSLLIGLRYSQSRKGNAFISFITLFSVAGIFLGVMALTIVSSVMNGFEGELKKRILGVIPHLVVTTPADSPQDWQQRLMAGSAVLQINPFLQAEALVQSPRQLTAVLLQGVTTDALPAFMQQALLVGDWQNFASQRYGVVLGRGLAEQLEVSRVPIREALRTLSSQGVLFTRQGGGTFVQKSDLINWPAQAIAPLEQLLSQDPLYRYDVLEARLRSYELAARMHGGGAGVALVPGDAGAGA